MVFNIRQARAFSLAEFSVVLVVISLVIGAVMVGAQIIRGAEIKTMVATVDDMKTAISQFELLYGKLPGDIDTATSIWSAATNGDGDGSIDGETAGEAFAVFDHLQRAGLLNGTLSGTWSNGFSIGGNVMKLTPKQAGLYARCCSTTDYSRTLSFNNHIMVFSVYSADDDYRAGAITPKEGYNIDQKYDDAIPDTGFIGGSGSYNGSAYVATGCYNGTGSSSAYESDNATYQDGMNCQMLFGYDW